MDNNTHNPLPKAVEPHTQGHATNSHPANTLETFIDHAAHMDKELRQEAAAKLQVQDGTIPFPVEVFPQEVQQIITATHQHLNFPVDYISASMLYAASVAIGNTHHVEVNTGWEQNAVMYLAIVGHAGANKSHPLTFALKPIVDYDKKTFAEYEQQRQEFERLISLSKKDKEGMEEPVKPVLHKYLLTDFTPEALAEVHRFNKRGIGVYTDELAGWFKNFDRYNKGSEMEFWLSVWSGKPINIDRKSGEPIFIPLPYISVAGTIQNAVLNELAKDSRSENGFMDRILFVIPGNVKKEYWSQTKIDRQYLDKWQTIMDTLLCMPMEYDGTHNPTARLLEFTPEAKKMLYDWQRKNTDQCNDADNDAIRSIYSKIEMYAIRLALVLEMMRYACNQSNRQAVGIEAVSGALKLVEYFKKSALKVNSIINNDTPLANYPADKQTLYNALPDAFSWHDATQVAAGMGIPERNLQRFLNDKVLFTRVKRGTYQKNI